MTMARKFQKIGILTSGGDAPGMNAEIRAVVRKAKEYGIEAVGIEGGYTGLINGRLADLDCRDVSNIICNGGTVLYSDRCPEFATEEGMQKAIATCREKGIEAIVAVGGDGTFRGATDLSRHGIPTVGLTGTIDNDITATDYTVGFDTAMNTVLEMVDRLRDTAESHNRCMVVEVMGRDCGEIALNTGIASGAAAIVIPEVPFDEAYCIKHLRELRESGKRNLLVIVSEGVKTPDGRMYGEHLTEVLDKSGISSRFIRLAHVVRGGIPTLRDRLTASRMAAMAVDLLVDGKSDLVVVEKDGALKAIEINFALVLDRMYKGKLKDGDLDKFTPAQVQEMKDICVAKKEEIEKLYKLSMELSK